jgi:hypothetical protein
MEWAEPTRLHRKSGIWGTRDLLLMHAPPGAHRSYLLQAKLAAAFVSPARLYFAIAG